MCALRSRRPRTWHARGRAAQDLDDEEYESTKAETLKQLQEFHASLARMMVRAACHSLLTRARG